MSILEGAVVYIDDEYGDETKDAGRFYRQLLDAGRPMRPYTDIPPDDHIEHWDGLAMVVLDWNLTESDARLASAATLTAGARASMVSFLKLLLKRYFCPVFIVSASGKDKIEDELRAAEGFPAEAIGPRIRVLHKNDVGDDLMSSLESEIAADPVLSTLRAWERGYQRAKNRMFIDFSEMSPNWPAYVVEVATGDGADPAYELAETLYSNLRHRLDPVVFDQEIILKAQRPSSAEANRRVRQGRTMIHSANLSDRMVYPGDLFRLDATDPDEVWINISPVCQTVPRTKSGDAMDKEVRLYLIKGTRAGEVPLSKKKWEGLESKRKGPNGMVIDTVLEGLPYYFDFDDAQILTWNSVRESWIGRVLPPFVTRLQQKHSAYLQTEGLPKVTFDLYKVAGAGGDA